MESGLEAKLLEVAYMMCDIPKLNWCVAHTLIGGVEMRSLVFNKLSLISVVVGLFVFSLNSTYADIVFISNRDSKAEIGTRESDIYVMDDHGINTHRVTTDLIYKTHPAWSPNGDRIAFSVELVNAGGREWEPQQTVELVVMDFSGKSQSQISDFKHLTAQPAWSPDGRSIAFASDYADGNFEIHVMDLSSGNVSQLTNSLAEVGGYASSPDWSPDGSKIVYALVLPGAGRHIYIIDINGKNTRPLVKDNKQELGITEHNTSPHWHPDNERILYRSATIRVEHKGNERVIQIADRGALVVRSEGNREALNLKIPDTLIFRGGCWGENGHSVFFTASKSEEHKEETDIYRYDMFSHEITNISNHPGMDFLPHWVEPAYSVYYVQKFATQWAKLKQIK